MCGTTADAPTPPAVLSLQVGDRHPKVGDNVLIGASATILGNISIGRGAQIAAGSLVLKPVPPHMMMAGTPAKVVGRVSGNPALNMLHWNQKFLDQDPFADEVPQGAAARKHRPPTPPLVHDASPAAPAVPSTSAAGTGAAAKAPRICRPSPVKANGSAVPANKPSPSSRQPSPMLFGTNRSSSSSSNNISSMDGASSFDGVGLFDVDAPALHQVDAAALHPAPAPAHNTPQQPESTSVAAAASSTPSASTPAPSTPSASTSSGSTHSVVPQQAAAVPHQHSGSHNQPSGAPVLAGPSSNSSLPAERKQQAVERAAAAEDADFYMI